MEIAGGRVIRGGNNLADGELSNATLQLAMQRVAAGGFQHAPQAAPAAAAPPLTIPRFRYAAMYGPTTGDQLQLGNTNLILQVSISPGGEHACLAYHEDQQRPSSASAMTADGDDRMMGSPNAQQLGFSHDVM